MLWFLFAVVVSLTDVSFKSVEPEVVVGGLVRFGEAWKESVINATYQACMIGLTTGETEGQRGGLP